MRDRIFWGIILILLGGGFLLDQFNVMDFGDILSMYWPIVLILSGLIGLLDKKTSKLGNLIVLTLGILLQLQRLDYIEYNVFKIFWPIILILVGLNIIFSKAGHDHCNSSNEGEYKGNRNFTSEDNIDSFVIMGGLETNNQSQQFKGGRATAIMGSIEIDLTNTKLYNNEAYIELNAIMGGIDISVPEDWKVEISGLPLLGGWSNNTRGNIDSNPPILKIKAFAIMGGIEIK